VFKFLKVSCKCFSQLQSRVLKLNCCKSILSIFKCLCKYFSYKAGCDLSFLSFYQVIEPCYLNRTISEIVSSLGGKHLKVTCEVRQFTRVVHPTLLVSLLVRPLGFGKLSPSPSKELASKGAKHSSLTK
jgi:hypothetical protein